MAATKVFDLPILSLKEAHTAAGAQQAAEQFKAAALSSGFMQVVDHGIPAELIERAFASAEAFFALPDAVKQAYPRNPHTNRGYELIGGQVLEGSLGTTKHEGESLVSTKRLGDQKEGLMLGVDDPTATRFGFGPNVWPDESTCPGLRATVNEYFETVFELTRRMMEIVALSLGIDPATGFNVEVVREPLSYVRFLHYPPSADVDVTGIGAHTDFGFITLLATSGTPGLELYHDGAWQECEPVQGAYILNIGDSLSQYTNGAYKSSLHRVMNKSGRSRYSIPLFLEGNPDFVVKPLGAPDDGTAYPTVEHVLRARFDSTYKY